MLSPFVLFLFFIPPASHPHPSAGRSCPPGALEKVVPSCPSCLPKKIVSNCHNCLINFLFQNIFQSLEKPHFADEPPDCAPPGPLPGHISIDSHFSPVHCVKYDAVNTRVGRRTDYDKLTLEIWTDGRISPDDASPLRWPTAPAATPASSNSASASATAAKCASSSGSTSSPKPRKPRPRKRPTTRRPNNPLDHPTSRKRTGLPPVLFSIWKACLLPWRQILAMIDGTNPASIFDTAQYSRPRSFKDAPK
ncbi:MAG: hypothetical protein IKQ55_04575 [Kiritimatiellae bacterium]|nr:hypothetical protein [Kiritimatiellia bacterium]